LASEKQPGDEFEPGEASETVVSLSQVLLAPLDALFKAQVHAGRSFLNFLLQISYGHKRRNAEGQPEVAPERSDGVDTIFSVDFVQEVPGADGAGTVRQKVSVPALALVPLRPLAIEQAEIALAMTVTHIGEHRQLRKVERDKQPDHTDPPWYLVDDPISLRGHVAPTGKSESNDPRVQVTVTVSSMPMPSGLEKLLTTLTQAAQAENMPPKPKDNK